MIIILRKGHFVSSEKKWNGEYKGWSENHHTVILGNDETHL